jgi:hypothetical protein
MLISINMFLLHKVAGSKPNQLSGACGQGLCFAFVPEQQFIPQQRSYFKFS